MEIGKYIKMFSEYMNYKKYSDNTKNSYISCIGKFLNNYNELAAKPTEVSALKIQEYLSSFKDSSTHKMYLSAIKLFYTKIVNQPHKLKNIEFPRKSHKIPVILSQKEVQKMFNVCHNLKHKVILALIYSCGLRVSELINLKWKNIDRSRMVINIIASKGNKDRQVALPPEIILLLEDYYRKFKSKEHVLNGQFDLKYSASSVLSKVKDLAKKAGINKRVYTHLLRHCTFTHMVDYGIDINIIQKLAGHSNVKTTMIYCHLSTAKISQIKSPISAISL